MCGSAVEVPWIDKVKAVLYAGLPGEAGGEAIVNLLFGKVNPSGKLAETWPISYEDCICKDYYGEPYKDAQYREGIYVGYRYYETAGVKARFPFGYGLSYTKFVYSDLNEKEFKEKSYWIDMKYSFMTIEKKNILIEKMLNKIKLKEEKKKQKENSK